MVDENTVTYQSEEDEFEVWRATQKDANRHESSNSKRRSKRQQQAESGDFSFAVDFKTPIENRQTITETDEATGEQRKIIVPLTMPQLKSAVGRRFEGFPATCGKVLFIPNRRGGVDFLEETKDLFGWFSNFARLKWSNRAESCVSKAEFMADWTRTTERRYVAIEILPHEPRIPSHFYACKFPEPGDGSTLNALLDRFCPLTSHDREFIKAMIVTLIWGGPPGRRPGFLITGPSGRGVGKSTMAQIMGELAGGWFEVSPRESIEQLKQRLLTPDSLTLRVAIADNVKSLRFSSADLEGLMTCPQISGKQMYHGNAQRPNTLIWIVTLNGASLVTDIAQRVVNIQLAEPERLGNWEDETRAFIDANREAIFADAIGFLHGPAAPLERYTRWAIWERDVLARLDDPAALQKTIRDRQAVSDVESEEADLVEVYFTDQLAELTYNPDRDRVFIPSSIAADWLSEATRERFTTVGAGRRLSQMIDENTLNRLTRNKDNTRGRGFLWEPPGGEGDVRGDIDERQADRHRHRDRNTF